MSNDLGYTAKKLEELSKAEVPAGFRLARIIRKNTKENPNAVSQAVFVPAPIDTASWMGNATIAEAVQNYMQGLQDKVIRQVLDSGRNIITDADIAVEAVASYLEENDETLGRLSKESIGTWYDAEVADTLTLVFADKLGIGDQPTPAEVTKLEQLNNQYKGCFQKLAGKSLAGALPPSVVTNLEKALELVPVSGFGDRIKVQLAKCKEEVGIDMLAL